MTIVLLHPFPLDSRLWGGVADLLDRDEVVCPDLPGFGGRARLEAAPSMDAVAADVWQQLGDAPEPVLVGISLGGYAALAMMRQRAIAGLALVGTKVTSDSDEARVNRERLALQMEQRGSMALYADQALPTLLGETTRDSRPAVVAQVREWIEGADPLSVAWMARAMASRPDSTPTLAAFAGPTLLLRGAQDAISSAADFDHMEAAAQNATRVTVEGCGHLPPVEDAQATAAAVSRWLEVYW